MQYLIVSLPRRALASVHGTACCRHSRMMRASSRGLRHFSEQPPPSAPWTGMEQDAKQSLLCLNQS